jgi:hypothetical protein
LGSSIFFVIFRIFLRAIFAVMKQVQLSAVLIKRWSSNLADSIERSIGATADVGAPVLLLHDDLEFLAVGCYAAWSAGFTPVRISKAYLSSLEAGTISSKACTAGAAVLLHRGAASATLELFGNGIVCVNITDAVESDSEARVRSRLPTSFQVGTWGFVDGEAALETDECLLGDLSEHYPLLSCVVGHAVEWT